jgi:SNF2 family DNA or RNA helicase
LSTQLQVTAPAGRKILYFCPSTMIGNVEREIRRWSPKRSVVVLGGRSKQERRFLLDMMTMHPEYIVICNYEAWRRDSSLIEDIIKIEFDTCIIDEAHNLKDRKSQAYRGIRKILTGSTDVPSNTPIQYTIPFVLPMTGTPILNKPQEFFTLLTLVDPIHFYNENYFLRDFCRQDWATGKWQFKPGGVESLFKRFPNLFLRRTKEQAGIVLPPKTVTIHEIEVDKEKYQKQAEAREQMRKWGSIVLDPDRSVTAMAEIAVYTRLRQIETWPAGISVKDDKGDVMFTLGEEFAESQKIDEIIHFENGDINDWDGILPEVVYNHNTGEGERTVIFSQFKEPLREIERRCIEAGIRATVLDGSTSESQREAIAIDFDNKYTPDPSQSRWDVVLCNYKVGGVGLNFTSATQMIVLDEEWNPGKRDQAYDRIHRMGQDKPVTIHVLRDKGTIDNWMAGLIEQKEALVDGFNESIANKAYDALQSGLI